MTSTALTSALWFIAILAMIPLALWLFKRSPAGARFSSNAAIGVMRQVASLSLSTSQRVVTVEVGEGDSRRWLILGVTPQNISMLYTVAPPANTQPDAAAAPVSASAAAAPKFAELLRRLRHDKVRDNSQHNGAAP